VAFDENMPRSIAQAINILASADRLDMEEPLEVLHALDLVRGGTSDVALIQAIAADNIGRSVIITCDKSMRTRCHERASFIETGCIGIVLRKQWNHAAMWDRARLTLIWWKTWITSVAIARPGTLLQCPWSERPKPLKLFD
jgi:hypothetical protein